MTKVSMNTDQLLHWEKIIIQISCFLLLVSNLNNSCCRPVSAWILLPNTSQFRHQKRLIIDQKNKNYKSYYINIRNNQDRVSYQLSNMKRNQYETVDEEERIPTESDALLSRIDETDETKSTTTITTGQKILDLAIPAAGALLIDPLMNLADTAFVGRFTGESAMPLAGMGSAASLLTLSFYLFNFLCTATTPLVAQKRAQGNVNDAIILGGQALSLAILLGSILSVLLLSFQQPLLKLMGTESTGANDYAVAFLSVRALAAPAVLCMEASTGVLRGYLDTKTPIVVLFVANAINLLLDIILIVYAGLGPMGAAIATTTAEWISAGLFLSVLAGKLPSAAGEVGKGSNVSIVPALAIPEFEQVQPLLVASSAVFFRAIVLQLSLSAAAAMAARDATATSAVAAHQIGIQLWLLGSFFCDSLAAASQGLVADALGRDDAKGVVDVAKTVFLYSLYLGLFLAALLQAGSSTGTIFEIFTQNPSTQTSLGQILPLIILAQPLNALVFAADGVIQGASEFPFQAKAMAVSGLTAVATFVALEVMGGSTETLIHVWFGLIALQFMRGVTSLWKLLDADGPINLLSLKKTP